jgi:hypothetical protein
MSFRNHPKNPGNQPFRKPHTPDTPSTKKKKGK